MYSIYPIHLWNSYLQQDVTYLSINYPNFVCVCDFFCLNTDIKFVITATMLASPVGLLLMNKCSLYFVYISNNFLVKIQDFCVKIHLKMDLRKALKIFLCEYPRNFMFFQMFLVNLQVYQPCSIHFCVYFQQFTCNFTRKIMYFLK